MRRVSDRLLVVFSRAPRAEARAKGFPESPGSRFFEEIARSWGDAAARVGARVAICAPPDDLPAWRRSLSGSPDVLWIEQRGESFGARLEDAACRSAALARRVVLTGGDVLPSDGVLSAAFGALDRGFGAVLAPAPDGGVSLVSLPFDEDLLGSVGRRRRDVLRRLLRRLQARRRTVALVEALPDVDRPAALRALAAAPSALAELVSLLRRACAGRTPRARASSRRHSAPALRMRGSRAPPLAA
jgi:glycosyltransferase A (GT-A) superfamily protein (DUF2064 family)